MFCMVIIGEIISLVDALHRFCVSDEKSWKAEAEIDMELFHQVCFFYLFLIFFVTNNYGNG